MTGAAPRAPAPRHWEVDMQVSTSLNRRLCLFFFTLLSGGGAGCTGSIAGRGQSHGGPATGFAGATGGQDPAALACAQSGGALNAGVTPLRRLTRDQYNNTVRDL